MQSEAPTFASAMTLHQAGRLADAGALYRKILGVTPEHAYALHGLGVIALQSARPAEARSLIDRAIAQRPDFAEAYVNRGNLLRAEGRLTEARQSYLRAITLRPHDGESFFNCGALSQLAGDSSGAWSCYHNALCLIPNHPKALNNLGILHKLAGQSDLAFLCFHRALVGDPGFAEAWYNYGTVLANLHGAYDPAMSAYRNAIALKPNYADAYNNLGYAQNCAGKAFAAENSLTAAFLLSPLRPEILNNLGMACQNQGRLDDALACYQTALAYRSDFPEAHNNRGMALLAAGRFEEGWNEREWRWQTPHLASARRSFSVPQWRGEPASGRRLLVHAEQGFGDSLQFCRYLPLVAARGLRVTLLVPAPLRRLFESLPGIDMLLADDDTPPAVDLHCPMMSLPLALSATLATIPARIPYLFADPGQVAVWRRRLGEDDGRRKIGLTWAGHSRQSMPDLAALDRRRSIAPERLGPLSTCPSTAFFSLQKAGPPPPADFPITDMMPDVEDFADTAALIANLDLVISVDTAVAHLAAALGKPVWLLNRFDSCWRWMQGRNDSPWYPTLRQFRQPCPGDWDQVIADVRDALDRFTTNKNG